MKLINYTLDYFDSLGIKIKNSVTYFFYSLSEFARFLGVYLFLIVLGYLILSRLDLPYKSVYILFVPPIIYFTLSVRRLLKDRAVKRMELYKEKEIELANKLRGFNLKISDGRLKAIFRKLIKFEILDENNPENTEQNFIKVFKKPFQSNTSSHHFLVHVAEVRYFIDEMLEFDSKNEKKITYKEIGFAEKFFGTEGCIGPKSLISNYSKRKQIIPEDFKNNIRIIIN